MKNRKLGIGQRIARLVAIATFLAVLIAALAQATLQVHRELHLRSEALQATAYAMASAAANGIASGKQAETQSALTAVRRIPGILMAIVVDSNGKAIATMGQTAYLDNDLFDANDHSLSLLFKGHLPVTVDIIKGGEVRGKLTMLGDISNLRTQLFLTLLSTFGAALAAAVIGVLASRPLQNRIVEPLSLLTSTIQTIRKSRSFNASLQDDNSPDEVGILVKSFNGLMDDIRFRDNALQKLAYFDPLTGLPNRVSFQRSLTEWLQHPIQDHDAAILLLNIHGFRAMNDAFSHSIGDAILMTVAATIKTATKEAGTVARYGGDEFALLLPEAGNRSDVEMAVARIQSAFFKPLQIGEIEIHISLTVGAVMISAPEKDKLTADKLMRQADLALADAKEHMAGRLQFFRQELIEIVQEETELGQALRQAAKAGAFHLHYQGQYDLAKAAVSGFEALIRWNHPERGPISPAIFIPLAERIGLVSVIGDWVLLEACRQAAAWHRMGQQSRTMSVNVSPAQILSAGFVEKVRGALRKTGLPPPLLCLELTESIFVGGSYAETVIIIETLAKDGVKFALDDFGTGYSSLSYLSKLPFHSVKVDRAFVAAADRDERKRGMLLSIINMLKHLGMSSVAEGAETASEVALLHAIGVNKVQGFAVAKPLPPEEAAARADEIDRRTQAAAG